jgi:hypothetical protein
VNPKQHVSGLASTEKQISVVRGATGGSTIKFGYRNAAVSHIYSFN